MIISPALRKQISGRRLKNDKTLALSMRRARKKENKITANERRLLFSFEIQIGLSTRPRHWRVIARERKQEAGREAIVRCSVANYENNNYRRVARTMEQFFFSTARRSTQVLPIIQPERIKSNCIIAIFKCCFYHPSFFNPAGRKGVLMPVFLQHEMRIESLSRVIF